MAAAAVTRCGGRACCFRRGSASSATFNVPRRAATADLYEEPPDEPMPELTLPAPPEVDLAALDKAMASRLPLRPPTK